MHGLVRQGDVFLSVLPASYFRLYTESQRFLRNTFLRLRCIQHTGSVERSASRKSLVGRHFLPLAVVGSRKSAGRIAMEEELRHIVSYPSGVIYFWILQVGRGMRDKKNVAGVANALFVEESSM